MPEKREVPKSFLTLTRIKELDV